MWTLIIACMAFLTLAIGIISIQNEIERESEKIRADIAIGLKMLHRRFDDQSGELQKTFNALQPKVQPINQPMRAVPKYPLDYESSMQETLKEFTDER